MRFPPSHHGAASSSLTTTTTHLTTRPRRLTGTGGFLHRSRDFKVGSGQRKRGFSSAPKGGFILRPKMASPGKPQSSTWHFSHGFVFANDTKVVYPRLPSMRQYGASVLAPRDDGASAAGEVPHVEVAGAGEQKTAVVDSASGGEGTAAMAEVEETPAVIELGAGEGESAEKAEPVASTVPFQPLAFKIPDDVFEAARNAPEGSPQSFWSYNLYRGPPGEDGNPTKVKVHYCTSEHTTERVLRQYFMDEKLLGFDLEWEISATKKQGVRQNVSLFQLASETRIALFHLALYPKKDNFVAPALREIMENPEVTKAGVWIKGDANRVQNYMGVECRGLLELSHLYRLVEWCSTAGGTKKPGKKLVRMATQVEDYLHLPLYKGPDVRTSDWSQALRMDQIIYSASDAYAAIHLYAAMNHARLALDPVPPLPYHAELNLPIRLADNVALPVEDDAQEQPLDADTTEPQTFAEYAAALSANHSVEIQDEDMAELGEQFLASTTTKKTPAKRKAATKKAAAPQPPRDPRVEEAELWAKQRIAARTTTADDGYAAMEMEMADFLQVKDEEGGAATVTGMTTSTETEDGGSTTTTTMAAESTEAQNEDGTTTTTTESTETTKTYKGAARGEATLVMLRAYYLWYANGNLDINGVARLLRDPPLARTTVAGYIIKAIQMEKLPYDKARMLEGVLDNLPPGALQYGQYKRMLWACRSELWGGGTKSDGVTKQ